jgi:hypothetical protein
VFSFFLVLLKIVPLPNPFALVWLVYHPILRRHWSRCLRRCSGLVYFDHRSLMILPIRTHPSNSSILSTRYGISVLHMFPIRSSFILLCTVIVRMRHYHRRSRRVRVHSLGITVTSFITTYLTPTKPQLIDYTVDLYCRSVCQDLHVQQTVCAASPVGALCTCFGFAFQSFWYRSNWHSTLHFFGFAARGSIGNHWCI